MQRVTPITPDADATEDEFYSALRASKCDCYIENEVEREQASAKWRKSARERNSRGASRMLRMRNAFQLAHDKLIHEGWQTDDALTYALEVFNVTYPRTYAGDETTWRRRVRQSFNSVKQHRHKLLDDDVTYGVEHALNALLSNLPHIVAAIFITSDRNKRCRIIRAIFRTTLET
jgi:hypothetical protein